MVKSYQVGGGGGGGLLDYTVSYLGKPRSLTIFKWDHQTWIKSPLRVREVTRIAWSNLWCERLMVIRMMYLALRNVSPANFMLVSVMASVHVHARVQGQPLDARHVCQSFKCSNWVTFIKWTKCTCYLIKGRHQKKIRTDIVNMSLSPLPPLPLGHIVNKKMVKNSVVVYPPYLQPL